eukprot:225431-Prymnesium_polylepis.1
MAGFYVHPYTHVLSARTPIPGGDYENTRPYDKRGWCLFELLTASVIKGGMCLWDLSLHKEGAAISFKECESTLRFTRPLLTDPEQMARQLREGVASGALGFTSGADADVVIGLYEQTFARAFNTYRQFRMDGCIDYRGLGWGTKEVPTLVAALKYAEAHCRPKDHKEGKNDAMLSVFLCSNKFTNAELARLQAAIPKRST